MDTKIKIVWICHFSNKIIREKLPLSKRKSYSDFAPWINNLIKEFEIFDNVNLHIISPHNGLLKANVSFNINGINYHFFKPDVPIVHKMIPRKLYFNDSVKYRINRFFIKRFIKNLSPDIVNLIGSENPYYSISVLDIKNIPVYLSCQTVYSNPLRKKYSDSFCEQIWDLEIKIHKKINYFGCAGRMHRDLVLKNNSNAIIFKMFFPIQKPNQIIQQNKKTDFVFFASGITNKKGVEDAIYALSIVKEQFPNVSLDIVGQVAVNYKEKLLKKIKSNKLENNIIFHSYFPIHSDMHKHITTAKYALLPIKLDVIPSTVIEAVLLELPVITYKTTGTPYLNKEKECVLISEINDISGLANNMLKLLNNYDLGNELKINAKEFVEKEFDNTVSALRLVKNYKAVINHYNNGIPIPENLLFSIKEFPKY